MRRKRIFKSGSSVKYQNINNRTRNTANTTVLTFGWREDYQIVLKELILRSHVWLVELNTCYNQRTNGPVNAHLISWPTKAQNIQNLENIW